MKRICITALTVVLIMLSTVSPVYAAENVVFHMSFYVHNWRGDTTSLEFDDGADATDEMDAEPIIIVDASDEPIIVDEEQEPAGEAEQPELIITVEDEEQAAESSIDSEQITAVVIEEISSEALTDEIEAQNAGDITIITTEETIEGLIIDTGNEVNISEPEGEEVEAPEIAPEAEIITIITTEVEIEATEETEAQETEEP